MITNRKEGNDQEAIHFPNTFRSKTLTEKKGALKATAPHYKQRAKKIVSKVGQTPIQNKHFTRTYMKRHTMAEIITKTRLFKYLENFTTKNRKFSDKKSDIFFIFLLKPLRGKTRECHNHSSPSQTPRGKGNRQNQTSNIEQLYKKH